SSGSTAEHTPAFAAAPGMPHTTLEASSCAMTLPPAATTSCAPCVPSEPMPVRIKARRATPQACAAVENIGSTAGRQKLISRPQFEIGRIPRHRASRLGKPEFRPHEANRRAGRHARARLNAALLARAELANFLDQVAAEARGCRDFAVGGGLRNVIGGAERERP